MNGAASESTLEIKVLTFGAATAPEPSYDFSVDEIGVLGSIPFPPNGSPPLLKKYQQVPFYI